MSQKNIAAVLLLIATALGGPPAVNHALNVHEQVIESVAIEGPSDCVVGELVELHVTGSRPSWLPPTQDCKDLGDTLLLSFRDEGEYEVIASAIAGQKTRTVKHVITVGVPDEPTPEPVQKSDDLTQLVVKWCNDSNAPPVGCRELGDNFIEAASTTSSVDDLLLKVAELNRETNQKGCERVLAHVQQYLFDNLQGKGFVDHQCAFDEIGQGLLSYADTANGSPRGQWHGI